MREHIARLPKCQIEVTGPRPKNSDNDFYTLFGCGWGREEKGKGKERENYFS